MAVSIAVNWTPPASSPLFDDGDDATVGGSNANEPQVTSTPTASASSPPQQNGNGRNLTTPGISIPRAPSPQAAAPRSYAAAAARAPSTSSSSSQPSTSPTSPPLTKRGNDLAAALPQLPPTAFQQPHAHAPRAGGYGHYPQQQPVHHAGMSPAYNNSTFARGGNQHFKGGPLPAAPAAPSAQRPAPLTYNDTFQQSAPGVTYAMASRGNLPPGAMAPSPPPSSAGGANGFHSHPHPYRRGTAPTGVPASGAPVSSAPMTSAPMAATGSGSSSSSASAGITASPSTSQLAPRAAPRSTPMRQSSSDSARAPRTESTRSTSSGIVTPAEDGSAPHSRSGSVSSQSSAYSSAMSDKASTIGRSTPTASALQAAKKPSPLSRAAAPRQDEEDDDDTNADYGGSDREDQPPANGRTTPGADAAKKKGFGGKLRKALSLSTMNEMQQAEGQPRPSTVRPTAAPSGRALPSRGASGFDGGEFGGGIGASPGGIGAASSAASISSRRSTRPPISGSTDGSGKRSLFNREFNSSTDNISISSTVSSASVMLRKVGNLGKMARRHSLMGLTNMFNKDKEAGKEGLHDDDFGTLPVPADETAMAKAGAKKGGAPTSRKGGPALASVSHATAELDHGADSSLSPAAHYVRQHQLQMKQQAEAEAAARQRQEAEAAAAAAAAAASAPKPTVKGKTTDDVVESRQKMIEKEKERLKSKRGWKNRLRGGGGSSSISSTTSNGASPTGLETIPYVPDAEEQEYEAPQGVYAGGYTGVPPPTSDGGGYGGVPGFDGGAIEDLEPPPRIGAGGEESGDDGETDSLRHWGEGIERSRASAARVTSPRSILKKSASYSRLDQQVANDFARPFAGRVRSNSYDVPQGGSQPGAPMLSSMSTTTAGVDRMDGVVRGDDNAAARPATQAPPPPPAPTVYGHHSNSSMPTLSLMVNPNHASSSSSRPSLQKKRINFTEVPIYHSTWPAHVYDRRGELATCNRLTQELAAQIKEELNSFKMEEMVVAPSSRIFTHFFV